MSTTRREFLATSAFAASVAGLGVAAGGALADPNAPTPAPGQAPGPQAAGQGDGLRILILGGTRFLGPALVESSLARGHRVTLFNRGLSNPELFPELEKLEGNRDPRLDNGLGALEGRSWDAVIDTSGYVPRHVQASASLLAGAVRQYMFISTASVYQMPSMGRLDENAPLMTMADETVEDVRDDTYGPLKVLCEAAAQAAMPGRCAIIRPGLIVGPRDHSDRFTYWPVRIAAGGDVLAPGDGRDPVQLIDVRDLADFCIHGVETGANGAFNAVGPECDMAMAEMLHGCKAVTGGCVSFTWAPASFLVAQGVSEWTDMPLWVRPGSEAAGMNAVDNRRALRRGLVIRPFAETVRATLDWYRSLPADRQSNLRWGIKADREREVLATWRSSQTP
jgi:2'-hydroxyisoflavone reductase